MYTIKIHVSLNAIFSETTRSIFTKFHAEPSVKWELKIYLHVNGHVSLSKMATISLDVEHRVNSFIRMKKALRLSLGVVQQ